jgi:hypothetical protein
MYRSSFAFALAMAALAAILACSTQPAQITFQRTYGGEGSDEGWSVLQSTDGGYVITGKTYSFGAGEADVYLIRTGANGDTLWTKTYGGTRRDEGHAVLQTPDGGYIIAGWTSSFGAGEARAYIVKTDAAGDTLWTRTRGRSLHDYAWAAGQTADSGLVFCGCTSFSHVGFEGVYSHDVHLVRSDAHGETLWTRTYGGGYYGRGYSVQQTADGGYIIAGGDGNAYLIKTDAGGGTEWSRTYGGTAMSVEQTTDGGYIVAGWTASFGAGGEDFYLIKTDPDGDTLWTRTFGGSGCEEAWSVHQTTDGGYIMTGFTESFDAQELDVYLVKTDSRGHRQWARTFGGADEDWGNSVRQTTDGGYIIAGYTSSFGAGQYDVYLIKTDSLGHVAPMKPTKQH